MNPDLVAVLEVESDLAAGHQEVDLEDDAVVEVAIDVADIDTGDGDGQPDFKSVRIDVAGDLAEPEERVS